MSKQQYLIHGRRVQIADLLEADLIAPGTQLTFRRPRLGDVFHAEVTSDGKLRVGQESYAAPSGAAMALIDRPVDGWMAWKLDDGRPLDSLRQLLLENAFESEGNTVGPARRIGRHEFLKEARAAAECGESTSIAVADLLFYWGASTRDYKTTQLIDADLSNHGLRTVPNYMSVGRDSEVLLVLSPRLEEAESLFSAPVFDGMGAAEDAYEDELIGDELDLALEPLSLDVGLTLGNFDTASTEMVTVAQDASLDEAITVMRMNGLGQIAVVSGGTLKGPLTWESIARSTHQKGRLAHLRDAIVRVPEHRFDVELLDVLDEIVQYGFVFVRGADGRLSGVVGESAVVKKYGLLDVAVQVLVDLAVATRRGCGVGGVCS